MNFGTHSLIITNWCVFMFFVWCWNNFRARKSARAKISSNIRARFSLIYIFENFSLLFAVEEKKGEKRLCDGWKNCFSLSSCCCCMRSTSDICFSFKLRRSLSLSPYCFKHWTRDIYIVEWDTRYEIYIIKAHIICCKTSAKRKYYVK